MLGTQGEGGVLFGIGQDLFHFLQACGGNDEAQGAAQGFLGMPGAAGQTETVHGDGRNGVVSHFELDAGMDGTALILGDGKNGAGDQLLQSGLGDLDGLALIDVGQVGVILGTFSGNVERCVAGTDGDLVVVVDNDGDRALGQAADDIAKELGRQDALTGIGDFGVDLVGDGSLHIVAGQMQAVTGLAQDAFDDRQAALLSNRSACDIQALNQHAFFTGKAHSSSPHC